MKLIDSFPPETHKLLDILLLLAEADKRKSPYPQKWLPRPYYQNRECYTGYPYLKPISKILYEVK
jgi:hypothetical protein